MKRLLLTIPVAVLAAGLMLFEAPACGQGGCGLKPLKPLPPLGCKDLVAECRCDAQGRNCRWEWVCVKR